MNGVIFKKSYSRVLGCIQIPYSHFSKLDRQSELTMNLLLKLITRLPPSFHIYLLWKQKLFL